MASFVDATMGGDTLMSSPTSGSSYPELFALDLDVAGEAAAQHYGQSFQRSMPTAPTLRPAPSAASWRQMQASAAAAAAHQRQSSVSSMSSYSGAGSYMQQAGQHMHVRAQGSISESDLDPIFLEQAYQAQYQQQQYQQHQLQPPAVQRRSSTSSISSSLSNPFEYSFGASSDAGSVSDLEGYDFGFGGSFGGSGINNGFDAHMHGQSHPMPHQLLDMPQHGQRSVSDGMVPTVGSIDPNMFRPKERTLSVGAPSMGLAIDPSVLMQGAADDLATAKPTREQTAPAALASTVRVGRAKGRSVNNVSSASGAVTTEDEDEGVAGGRKSSHARKQKPNHIPRPRNAFILFRKHVVDAKLIPPSVEIRHQNVSVIVAKMWAEASPEQKEEFNELARIEKEEHQKKYPGYRYQPVYRRTNVIRRRVRKDEAEEEKCRSVAELLIKGKSGEELEEEIKEKMAQEQSNKAKTAKRANEANDLSKGALRALKAQAKQAEARQSPDWTDASAPNSRQGSLEPELDSEADGEGFAMSGAPSHEKQLLQYAAAQQNGGLAQQAQLPFGLGQMGQVNGGNLGPWPPAQQTYAYPEMDGSYNQQAMFAYAQPAPADYLSYDQALPFSPSAHTFSFSHSQNPAPYPHQVWSQDQSSYPTEKGASTRGGAGLDSTLPVPPMTARWNASFQPGGEGVTYSEMQGQNPLLQDFGAALMQAEEMLGWA